MIVVRVACNHVSLTLNQSFALNFANSLLPVLHFEVVYASDELK